MRPQIDLVLTWGDFVVAQKRVPGGARLVPSEHFALPDELSAHSLHVRATVAEDGARPPRFRFDRAFGFAVLVALLTHVAVGWLSVSAPEDQGAVPTSERRVMAPPASVDVDDTRASAGLADIRGHVARSVAELQFEDDAVSHGRLDSGAVRYAMRRNEGRFRRCYLAGLPRNLALEGVVNVAFVIAPNGTVASVADTTESTLPDADVRSCIRRVVSSLFFPEPGSVVRVTYLLRFSPLD